MPMPAPLRTHIQIQRKSLLRVAWYSVEAFLLCLLGIWLFQNTMPLYGKLIVSGAFAAVVLLAGAFLVLFTSYLTLKNADANSSESGPLTKTRASNSRWNGRAAKAARDRVSYLQARGSPQR